MKKKLFGSVGGELGPSGEFGGASLFGLEEDIKKISLLMVKKELQKQKLNNPNKQFILRGRVIKKLGRPLSGKAPTPDELYKMYINEGLSIRKIAAAIGSSKDIIHYALRRYKIRIRPNIKRSQLQEYSIKQIERRIRLKGLRGAANYFRVNHSTLLHHLQVRKEYKGGDGQ